MPYIAIKAFPKDEETKKKLADQINDIVLKTWGCPQEAISISIEEVKPADWDKTVMDTEVRPKADKMLILEGKKKY